jgi:hypothetical protein
MLPHSAVLDSSSLVHSERVALSDDGKTNVHVFSRALRDTVISVAKLGPAQRITDVCRHLGAPVVAAMSGGFFAREARKPLGDLWIGGQRQPHVPFQGPWHKVRGSLHVAGGLLGIDQRRLLPARPDGDLLQAGPLLVMAGKLVVDTATDLEGFSAGSDQFDSDITDGRYPRAALAVARRGRLLAVACDGRADDEAGLTMGELAEALIALGAVQALNLDGGGSTSLVAGGRLCNVPRESHGVALAGGRPISTALTFSAR